jgi:hypothetical protein
MMLTRLVIVRQISGRTCSASGIIQEKLVDCAGDASPATFLFLPSGLEVLEDKAKDSVELSFYRCSETVNWTAVLWAPERKNKVSSTRIRPVIR